MTISTKWNPYYNNACIELRWFEEDEGEHPKILDDPKPYARVWIKKNGAIVEKRRVELDHNTGTPTELYRGYTNCNKEHFYECYFYFSLNDGSVHNATKADKDPVLDFCH